MKIVCCTMFSPSHQELADISVPNLERYCQKHGYDMRLIKIENDKWEFKKHETFKELFEKGYDLIWYKDIDSLITNMSIPITDFVDDSHDFFLTMDFNELNGGSVIIKNTKSGVDYNNAVLEGKNNYENEQNFFNETLNQYSDIVKIVSHPSINSYDYSLYIQCKELIGHEDAGDWQPNNFVIHFPGLGTNDRIELLKEFSQKVIE